jgi:serine/threonine-protein kinase
MSEAWTEWVGRTIDGKYALRELLGASGHGAVFLTESERGSVALKVVPADLDDYGDAQLSRWAAAAKLFHPHLLGIFQSGRFELEGAQFLYVLMECAEENLSLVLPQRALTEAEALQMLDPVVSALVFLNGKGLVHGGIKPANILALGDQIKLSCDGVRPIALSQGLSASAGDYDPPEAADGKNWPAADVWSLGITLVEVLTQRRPAWEKSGASDPALPETLPAPFLELAQNCLRRDPQKRWTIAQINEWLRRATSAPPSPKSPIRKPPPSRMPMIFSRPYAVPIALVGLALAALVFGPALFNRSPEAQPAPAIAPEPPRTQPAFVKKLPPATVSPTKEPGSKKPGAGVATPPPAAPAPEAGTKPHASSGDSGEVFRKVLPDVPQKALDTITGTVRVVVRVAVDSSGKVTDATLESSGPSQYFAKHALQAARRWEFWAPKVDGNPVAREWLLRFSFTQTGVEASAAIQN